MEADINRLQPGPHGLTPIADTSARFADFAPYVAAINDRGSVAFQATTRDGMSGVYRGAGGPITPIIELPTSESTVCSHPDLDAGEAACCYVELASGGRAIAIARAGLLTTLAPDAGPLGPTVNEAGTCAFRAEHGGGMSSICTGRDGLVTTIAATGPVFGSFHGLPVINSSGVVVFRADPSSGGQGIYTGDGGAPARVVETGLDFSSLGHFPVLDDAGSVAFCATLAKGTSGVFVATTAGVETIIDTTGAFESFRGVLFDGHGAVIFYATPRDGQLGVFVGPDPDRDRVLGVGTSLFDSTVVEFALNPVSINRAGQIAIRVRLGNGQQFVLRADPTGP